MLTLIKSKCVGVESLNDKANVLQLVVLIGLITMSPSDQGWAEIHQSSAPRVPSINGVLSRLSMEWSNSINVTHAGVPMSPGSSSIVRAAVLKVLEGPEFEVDVNFGAADQPWRAPSNQPTRSPSNQPTGEPIPGPLPRNLQTVNTRMFGERRGQHEYKAYCPICRLNNKAVRHSRSECDSICPSCNKKHVLTHTDCQGCYLCGKLGKPSHQFTRDHANCPSKIYKAFTVVVDPGNQQSFD